MNKLMTATALVAALALTGCGEDEEEKQKARIEANTALLASQQNKIAEANTALATAQAELETLQALAADAQQFIDEGEAARLELLAAEESTAALRVEAEELQDAMKRIDEFQARAKLVNPEEGSALIVNPVRKSGGSMNTARSIEPAFNTLMYYYYSNGASMLLSDISSQAQPRIQACLNGDGCLTPNAYNMEGTGTRKRIIDWDAGLVVYAYYGSDASFEIFPFEHFGEEFAQRMHAEAEELRAKLIAEAAAEASDG